jgi:hypothetical protein
VKTNVPYSHRVRRRRFSHRPGAATLAAAKARFSAWYARSTGWMGQDRNGNRKAM